MFLVLCFMLNFSSFGSSITWKLFVGIGFMVFISSALIRSTVRSMSGAMSGALHYQGQFSIVYVTVPNEDVAKNLSRKMVETKLAACVNIVPKVTSIYEWEGKINEDTELMLIIKTRTSRIDDLSLFVRENHPYKVPEVISMKIENGNEAYLNWLSDRT